MPELDPDLRIALEVLRRGFGDVEVLGVASRAPATVQYVQGEFLSDADEAAAGAGRAP